eukprot:NODE_433_length_7485_cov_0.465746.p5 type:complete len:166 gc:universal NODE_433_length_7485_cov_0.465746:2521-3018(+)
MLTEIYLTFWIWISFLTITVNAIPWVDYRISHQEQVTKLITRNLVGIQVGEAILLYSFAIILVILMVGVVYFGDEGQCVVPLKIDIEQIEYVKVPCKILEGSVTNRFKKRRNLKVEVMKPKRQDSKAANSIVDPLWDWDNMFNKSELEKTEDMMKCFQKIVQGLI